MVKRSLRLFSDEFAFHRTPKKGSKRSTTYKPIKDLTCLVEIILGIYCLASFQMFLGFTNFLVSRFSDALRIRISLRGHNLGCPFQTSGTDRPENKAAINHQVTAYSG